MTRKLSLQNTIFAASIVMLSGCGKEWNCSSGECHLHYDASGCKTKDAYEQLQEEFVYINKTRDTRGADKLFQGGLCKRFPKGTRVYVMEEGMFTVRVRYTHLPNESDRWMSAEALRSVY